MGEGRASNSPKDAADSVSLEAGTGQVPSMAPITSWENSIFRALLKSLSALTYLLSLSLSLLTLSESDSDFKVHFQVFLTKSSSLEFTLHSLTKYLLAHFVCYTLGWVPRIYPFHKHYWAYTLCEPLFKWLGLQW